MDIANGPLCKKEEDIINGYLERETNVVKKVTDDKGKTFKKSLDEDKKLKEKNEKEQNNILLRNEKEKYFNKVMIQRCKLGLLYQKMFLCSYLISIIVILSLLITSFNSSLSAKRQCNSTIIFSNLLDKIITSEFYEAFTSILNLLFTLILMVNIIIKNYLSLQIDKHEKAACSYDNIFSSGYYLIIIFELIISIPYPFIIFLGKCTTITIKVNDVKFNIQYEINELLSSLMFMRIIFIYQTFICILHEKSSNSNNIRTLMGIDNRAITTFKYYFEQRPLTVVLFIFLMSLLTNSMILYIIESPFISIERNPSIIKVFDPSSVPTLQNLSNCFWCIMISMLSIGPGNTHPLTIFGRVTIGFGVLNGGLCVILFILALFRHMTLSQNEINTISLLNKLGIRKRYEKIEKDIVKLVIYRSYLISIKSKEQYELDGLERKTNRRNSEERLEYSRRKSKIHRINQILKKQENKLKFLIKCRDYVKDNLKDCDVDERWFLKLENLNSLQHICQLLTTKKEEVASLLNKITKVSKNSQNDIGIIQQNLP